MLDWKIECDAVTANDWTTIAQVIAGKITFREVYGVPRGGLALADALTPFAKLEEESATVLVVDDVFTTGGSMETHRKWVTTQVSDDVAIKGVVLFARGECPDWVWPVFSLGEWLR